MTRAKPARNCVAIPADAERDPHRATDQWDPAAFVLVDVAALTGAERDLVDSVFGHHTAAMQIILQDLMRDHEIPIMRARSIIQSCSLILTALDATELRLPIGVFTTAAASALTMAGDLLDVASDIQGEA